MYTATRAHSYQSGTRLMISDMEGAQLLIFSNNKHHLAIVTYFWVFSKVHGAYC